MRRKTYTKKQQKANQREVEKYAKIIRQNLLDNYPQLKMLQGTQAWMDYYTKEKDIELLVQSFPNLIYFAIHVSTPTTVETFGQKCMQVVDNDGNLLINKEGHDNSALIEFLQKAEELLG